MGDGPDLLPHHGLISALQSLCEAGRSGTMFIITGDNHAAQLILRDGEIVGLSYRLLRGLDALPSLQSFEAGRYRYVDEPVDRTDPGLPPTLDLLALLGPAHSGPVEPPRATATIKPKPAHDAVRSVIVLELTEFLGPMAGLVCQEHLAHVTDLSTPDDLPRLVDAIAKEIGDPTKEAQFKQRVLARLRGA